MTNEEKQIEGTVYNYKKRLYKVWINMKQRCYNPKHDSYKTYGGKGITLCEEWRTDFSAFEKWSLEHGYDENAPKWECTIDRIDNNRGYSPENCQWVSIQKNLNKRGTCLMYSYKGKTQSLADWSRELGINYNALLSRMHRNGFDFEQAIIPRKNGSRHLDYSKI